MSRMTIIMPVWRRPQRTRRAIDSVLAQTDPNWELLVVGDGEPGLDAIASEYSDPRIRFHNMPTHEGAYGTQCLNWGLDHAAGECICFLGNDDYLLPNHVSDRAQAMRSTAAGLCVFYALMRTGSPEWIRGGAIRNGVVGGSELCVAAELTRDVRFRSGEYGHDWTYIQDLLAKNPLTAIVPSATYVVTNPGCGGNHTTGGLD